MCHTVPPSDSARRPSILGRSEATERAGAFDANDSTLTSPPSAAAVTAPQLPPALGARGSQPPAGLTGSSEARLVKRSALRRDPGATPPSGSPGISFFVLTRRTRLRAGTIGIPTLGCERRHRPSRRAAQRVRFQRARTRLFAFEQSRSTCTSGLLVLSQRFWCAPGPLQWFAGVGDDRSVQTRCKPRPRGGHRGATRPRRAAPSPPRHEWRLAAGIL